MDHKITTDTTASRRSSTRSNDYSQDETGSVRGSKKYPAPISQMSSLLGSVATSAKDGSIPESKQVFLPESKFGSFRNSKQVFMLDSKPNSKPVSKQSSDHGSAQRATRDATRDSTLVSVVSYAPEPTLRISSVDLKGRAESSKKTADSTRSSKAFEKRVSVAQFAMPRHSIVKKSFERGPHDPKKRVSVATGSRTEFLGGSRSSKESVLVGEGRRKMSSVGTVGSVNKKFSFGSTRSGMDDLMTDLEAENQRNKLVYHQKHGQLFTTVANEYNMKGNQESMAATADNLASKSLHDEIQKEMIQYTLQSGSFHLPLGIGDTAPIPISSSGTDTSTTTSGSSHTDIVEKSMRYLMKLMPYGEEEYDEELKAAPDVIEEVIDEQPETGESESMRQAQRYLRVHKIFEFLQFMTCHLLSACPENPVEFFAELLEKCLIYRAGFSNPPLLYTPKHLECLFYLMDRMRTGYIDVEQYKTGMVTLGICSYNPHPPLSNDDMVSKEFFVEEANECLSHLLDDMIRRRWIRTLPPPTTPPDSPPMVSKHDLRPLNV